MIENAGRKGNGTTSNKNAPRKTNAYCYQINFVVPPRF